MNKKPTQSPVAVFATIGGQSKGIEIPYEQWVDPNQRQRVIAVIDTLFLLSDAAQPEGDDA